jgi:hypothetical protein
MEISPTFLLYALIIGGVLLWLWLQHRGEEKRKEVIKELCLRTGFTFDPGPADLKTDWFTLPLFSRGRNRRATNLGTKKSNNSSLVFFDYRFTTGSGKSQSTNKVFVVAKYGTFSLPEFTLAPEDFFSKVAQAVGYHDIDFEHDPEFSKRYVLRGKDEELIRKTFNISITRALTQQQSCQLEGNANGIIWFTRKRPTVEEIPETLQKVQTILDLF